MTEVQVPPGFETTFNRSNALRPGDRPFSLDQERNLQQIIFDEAIDIACDWLEASGNKPITEAELQNLYDNGYASSTPAEVLEIFYNWEDYQAIAQSYYKEREDPEIVKHSMVESLRQEAEVGLVPPIFFKQAEKYKVDNPSGGRKLIRFRITEEAAPDEVVLQRYYKYIVTGYLTKDRPPGTEITEERKTNIALGFGQETGKPLSSFYGSLKNSISILTEEELALAVETLDAHDFIYPESRKKHLQTLIDVGRSKPEELENPEYYYDLKLKKIVLLGRSALKFVEVPEGRNHLERLQKESRLLIGSLAVNAYNKGLKAGNVSKLGDLLRNGVPESLPKSHMRTMDLTRHDFIEIGHWISSVVTPVEDPHHMHLNESVFMNAKHLGIGFSINKGSRFINEFGSMAEYYETLGEKRTNRKGITSTQEAINKIVALGVELGRRPTYLEQVHAYQEDKNFPHPGTINRRLSFSERSAIGIIFDSAGIPKQRLVWDTGDCLKWGVDYMRQTGKVPREGDIAKGSKEGTCAGRRIFKKNFGSHKKFQEQVRELYQRQSVVLEDIAA